ncbi:MAG: hypothetical protein ABSB54_03200 [Acidimicrobiales bacterium]|jgi:hypothetical protein
MSAEASSDDGRTTPGDPASVTAEAPAAESPPPSNEPVWTPTAARVDAPRRPAHRPPRRSLLRRGGPPLLCILIYSVLAAFVYGVHPPATSSTLPPCACGDISSQVWFLAWPAYALSHGLNPFYSSWVDYPHGVNLMNNTAYPLLGILFAPFTLKFGALSTFSLLMRLAFALSGISMCFVLRRWTKWWPAAFIGGLVYEFSPFMVGQSQSHLFLTFVPLPPIMMALFDELVVRRRHLIRNGVLLGVVIAAQLMISPEILVISLLAAVCAFIVMAVRHPVAARERVGDLLRGFATAVVTFAILGAYAIWIYFRGPYHVSGPPHPVADLDQYHSYPASLIYPTNLQRISFGSWLTKGMALLQKNGVEHTTYVGIPLLVLLAFIVIRWRKVGQVQLFMLIALGGWVVTLGRGTRTIKLPFDLMLKIPILNGALDLRYSLLMYLGIAVVLAIGLDRMRREGILGGLRRSRPAEVPAGEATASRAKSGRWAPGGLGPSVACLAIAAVALAPLFPALPYKSAPPRVPALFTDADSPLYANHDTTPVVLSYPLPISYEGSNDQALLWQSAARMRFKLIAFRGAVAGPTGRPIRGAALLLPPYEAEQVLLWALYGEPRPPPAMDQATAKAIEIFLRAWGVDAVTVVPHGHRTALVLDYYEAALEAPPILFKGAYVWPDVQQDLRRIGLGSS